MSNYLFCVTAVPHIRLKNTRHKHYIRNAARVRSRQANHTLTRRPAEPKARRGPVLQHRNSCGLRRSGRPGIALRAKVFQLVGQYMNL